LKGLDRRVYEATESGASEKRLITKFSDENHTESQVAASVQRLLDLKVVMLLSGRLYGLALTDPVSVLLCEDLTGAVTDAVLHPQAALMRADLALDRERTNIAARAGKLPETQSLADWVGGLG
jgi:hypothetical protein